MTATLIEAATVIEAALTAARAGISVIPVNHKTKKPCGRLLPRDNEGNPKWKPFQERIASEEEIRRWFGPGGARAFAVVCGRISGGLLGIDFDAQAERLYPTWQMAVGLLAGGLPVQRTGGGPHRRQVFLRCDDSGSNDQLAWVVDEQEATGRAIAIETRGEGGYCVLAPSLHPSGNRYTWLVGDLTKVPTIPQAQADALLAAARKLDECPHTRQERERIEREALESHNKKWSHSSDISVIDAYNKAHPIEIELEANGYTRSNGRFIRPGGKSGSVQVKEGRSFHWNSNDALNNRPGKVGCTCNDAFGIFCHFKYAGDYRAAVKAVAAELGVSAAVGPNDGDIEVPVEAWPSPLGDAALHGLAGRVVRAIEPHTEADPAALLIQILVAYGNAIGRNASFEADGARHHANLYAVLIGETSKSRKGTSWAQILRPFATATPTWAEDRIAEGLSSGEGLIWAVRDPICKREPTKDKGRVTGYQEIEVDPGVQDKRLLVQEGEYAQVLKVVQREGNTLSPVLRRAWDGGGKLQSMTKNSPAVSTNPHISIIGHIVKDELTRLLESTEAANGFANRFLWVCVRRSKCLPDGGRLYEVNFSPIVKDLEAAIEYGQRPDQLLARDAEARELWHKVYPALSEGKPGLVGSMTSRAEAQVMRMAMIYALLDCSPWIKVEHLQAALAVWEYCEASARYVFGRSLGDPVADEILAALKARPEGMSRTHIRDLFDRNRSKGHVAKALSLLLGQNLVHCEPEKTEGRPKEVWFAGSRATTKMAETT